MRKIPNWYVSEVGFSILWLSVVSGVDFANFTIDFGLLLSLVET